MVRIRQHHSPFLPDKNHIHHKFLAAGLKPRTAMVSIISVSMIFTLLNLWLSTFMNINIIVVLDVIIWISFNMWLNTRIDRNKALTDKTPADAPGGKKSGHMEATTSNKA